MSELEQALHQRRLDLQRIAHLSPADKLRSLKVLDAIKALTKKKDVSDARKAWEADALAHVAIQTTPTRKRVDDKKCRDRRNARMERLHKEAGLGVDDLAPSEMTQGELTKARKKFIKEQAETRRTIIEKSSVKSDFVKTFEFMEVNWKLWASQKLTLEQHEARRMERQARVVQMIYYRSDRWMELALNVKKMGVVSSRSGKRYPPGTEFIMEITVPGEAVWDHLYSWTARDTKFIVLEDIIEIQAKLRPKGPDMEFWSKAKINLLRTDHDKAFAYILDIRNDPINETADIAAGRRFVQGVCFGYEHTRPLAIAEIGPLKEPPVMCDCPDRFACGWYLLAQTKIKGCGLCPAQATPKQFCSNECKRKHHIDAHPESKDAKAYHQGIACRKERDALYITCLELNQGLKDRKSIHNRHIGTLLHMNRDRNRADRDKHIASNGAFDLSQASLWE